MADLADPDSGTAYYRSNDPVKNIKIKVNLCRSTGGGLVIPKPSQDVEGHMEMKDMSHDKKKDKESFTFDWQKKIFSQREIQLYSSRESFEDVLEQTYHDEVVKIGKDGSPTTRLFSYVDHDGFTDHEKIEPKLTTSPDESPSYLASRMSELRRRKRFGLSRNQEKDNLIPKSNLVENDPPKERKIQNHFLTRPYQTMYIMADLSSVDKESTVLNEYVLCTIQVDPRGVIAITPDFNRGRKAYRVEAGDSSREMFSYTLEHVSQEMSEQERERENKMYRELYSRHAEFLQSCVGGEFEMPPADVLRVIINGEIISAKNFEYDDLYVHFFLDLPRNWFAHESMEMSGVTQTCSTTTVGKDEVAHFSFPFSFELFYKNDRVNPVNRDLLPSFPTLYFEVLSIDTIQRYRTEGYTYTVIPPTAGTHLRTLHCWRPAGSRLSSEQRRFFIGGSPELEDPAYMTVPSSSTDESRISKYGFVTESTGELSVKFNIIQQSKSFLDSKVSKKGLSSLIDKLGGGVSQSGVHQVLDAFRRARERMVAARESLQYLKELKLDDEDETASADDLLTSPTVEK